MLLIAFAFRVMTRRTQEAFCIREEYSRQSSAGENSVVEPVRA